MMHARRSAALSSSIWRAAFAGALASVLAALCAGQARGDAPPPNPFDLPVRPLGVGDLFPDARYVDQAGHTMALSQFRGRTTVVGFIYTNCADKCPLLTSKFGALAAQLPQARFAFLEISIDPARDDVKALNAFANSHHVVGSNWHLLTGPPDLLELVAKPLGVTVVGGANGEILHPERVVIVAPNGRIADYIDDAAWQPGQLAAVARNVAGLSSNPLTRLDVALGKTTAAECGSAATGRAGLRDLIAVGVLFIVAASIGLLVARRLVWRAS